MRSTYIRWAISINGLEVAAEKYASVTWQRDPNRRFFVTSLRNEDEPRPDGRRQVVPTIIAEWNGPTASKAHRKTMPMLAAFGVIDLYGNLEDFVFDIFKVFLNAHPEHILRGDEFRDLRRLRHEAKRDESKKEAWDKAWKERLERWQRNKLYDGLGKVFRAFCTAAGLKTPSFHKYVTIENWAETIEIIGLVRNGLTHGVTVVTAEIADACKKPHAMTFDFQEGKPLTIRLDHLQGIDYFCEQLLTALNFSLIEKVHGPLPPPGTKAATSSDR
jgi:hypothetical protein